MEFHYGFHRSPRLFAEKWPDFYDDSIKNDVKLKKKRAFNAFEWIVIEEETVCIIGRLCLVYFKFSEFLSYAVDWE